MTQRLTELLPELLALPAADRAELAHRLFDSLDGEDEPDDDPAEVEAAWGDEIARRLEEYRSGRAKPIPWEEARKRIFSDLDGDDDDAD